MSAKPPKLADRFLKWYCRPDWLEDIQGDLHELHERRAEKNHTRASLLFYWDVLRFFRFKNIRKPSKKYQQNMQALSFIRSTITITFRSFRRNPANTLLNIIGLSAGFVCAILIFLWVTQELSYDQFHKDAKNIFKVITHAEANGSRQTYGIASQAIDVSTVPEIENSVRVSTGTRWPHELCFRPVTNPENCIYLSGVYSEKSFFEVFNFPIVQGDQHPLSKPDQMAISENMAQQLFGSDNAIGKMIKVDGTREVFVTSVFENVPVNSTLQFDFVLPFAILKKEWGLDDNGFAGTYPDVYVKTAGNIDVKDLTVKLNGPGVLTENLRTDKLSYQAFPIVDWRLHSKFENGINTGGKIEYVRLFIVIALLIVVMAVINFINMSTARTSTRSKEIGVRKVIGAHRTGIVAQFMGESFITVSIAFFIATVAAALLLPMFNSFLPDPVDLKLYEGNIPFYLSGFLLAIALMAGLYPSFILSSVKPLKILKDNGTGKTSASNGVRKSMLVVQLTVSLVIIMFSGVIYWQLKYINSKDLGFDRESMIRIEPTYQMLQKIDAFKHELFKGSSIIGITASNVNPLNTGGANLGVSWPGKPADARIAFVTIGCTYEFVSTFGLHIAEGRDFLPQSQDTVNTEVLVTSEAIKTMKLKNPIGEHIKIGNASCTIVGVVNDFHTGSLRESRLPVIIYRENILHTAGLYLKYRKGETQEAMAQLKEAYHKIEPSYTMKYSFQDDTFNEIYQTERTASRLIVVFTIVTLVIALIGIIGLATFNVIRKSKEIGIRRVLGASLSQILTMLSNEFSVVIILSSVITIPLVFYSTQKWLSGFAYHIATPWWWYAVTLVGIAAVTISVVCLLAMRTISVNPSETLRSE